VTHADLEDSTERTDIFRRTISESWRQGILPIVNENDALSIEELDVLARGGDNDRNALLLAKLFEADQLILLTNTN
jgi:glutamate 5-kinase